MTRGPNHDCRNATHSENNQFTNRNRQENWRDTRVDNRYHGTSRPQRESNRFGGLGVGDNRRFDSLRRSDQYDHRLNNHGGRQGGSRNGAFRGQKSQNSRMIRWALKLSEFNIEWEHRSGTQNVVADVLSRNPVYNVDRSQISYAALRALALNSMEQLIQEQREDPELGHIFRYLENPDDGSVNATVCDDWSQDFKLIDGLLSYAKYCTTLGELRFYIPQSVRGAIMNEFHDQPLAGYLGRKKTYLKLRDTCYFPYMRKYIFKYVSTCDRCQKFNYKNALPADRLIPIVSNYPQ
ncbi:retrovirus-related Pol polyprotein from transposon 297 [Trichonephila clavipes]|nr:retrovirus-related Pol polyprotein from transposon 297 [Trichonephila clavipes]